MDGRFARRPASTLALAALVLAAGGCGGGSSTPTTVGGGAPVIANLVATFLSQACTTTQSQAGTTLSVSLSYTDPEGDVRGGRLATSGSFTPSGSVGRQDFLLPADATGFSGTTSGTIQALPCVRFGSDTGFNLDVTIVDAAGHISNSLSVQPPKPNGAPEVLHGGTGGAFGPRQRP